MINNLIFKNLAIIIFLSLVFSCAPKKQIAGAEKTALLQPKIIFLNYSINKNNNDKKKVSLINKIVVDGSLKNKKIKRNQKNIGDLECLLLDKDSKEIEKLTITNPLIKKFEYLNENKRFEKKIILLDTAEFSVRLQLPPKCKHIIITELTATKSIKLITTKIN